MLLCVGDCPWSLVLYLSTRSSTPFHACQNKLPSSGLPHLLMHETRPRACAVWHTHLSCSPPADRSSTQPSSPTDARCLLAARNAALRHLTCHALTARLPSCLLPICAERLRQLRGATPYRIYVYVVFTVSILALRHEAAPLRGATALHQPVCKIPRHLPALVEHVRGLILDIVGPRFALAVFLELAEQPIARQDCHSNISPGLLERPPDKLGRGRGRLWERDQWRREEAWEEDGCTIQRSACS
jgi:hypothetical protein